MLVEEIMDKNVIAIPSTTTIAEALQLLQKHRIRHLPIIDEDKQIIGIVSDRDVRDEISTLIGKDSKVDDLQNTVETIMSNPVITIHPLDFIEDIAHIFYDKEYASLPVVSDNKLLGIITEREMLYTLIQLTGTHVQSSHIEVIVPDRPGILPEVASVFGNRKINITSVLVYPYKKDPNYKILVFRFQTMNPFEVTKDLRQAGYELMWPNDTPGPQL